MSKERLFSQVHENLTKLSTRKGINITSRVTVEDVLVEEEHIISGFLCKDNDVMDYKSVPFMSVPHSVDTRRVLHKFKDDWGLSDPRIVLLVVSSPYSLGEWTDRKAIDSFLKGLINALKATEMWVCTSGLDLGVSKMIGEAMNREMKRREVLESDVHEASTMYPETALIGICQQDDLSFSEKIGKDSNRILVKDDESSEDEKGKRNVNFHHDYFILVKDKFKGKSGVTDFVVNFENHLIQKNKAVQEVISPSAHNRPQTDPIATPVIAILIRGNIDKIDFILSHLKLRLPLIILRGSGGLADLLAFGSDQVNWSEYREPAEYAEYVEKFLKPVMSSKICDIFPELERNNLFRSLLCDKIFDCLRCGLPQELQEEFITILNIKDPNCRLDYLPEHLLRTVLKSQLVDYLKNPKQMTKDLHIAIDWNSPHVAVDQVFAKGSGSSFEIDNETFFRALTKQDRQDFVTIFLRKGFVVHKFLNTAMLVQLFQFSMNYVFFKKIVWEAASGFNAKKEIQSSYFDDKLNTLLKDFTGIPTLINTSDLDFNSFENYGDYTEVEAEQKAIQVLIIWTILSCKISLAKAIWRESQQPIHLALMCSTILNKLESFIMDSDYKYDVAVHSKEFSKMACDVLTKCYDEVPCKADDALYEENVVWSYKSLIEIAAYAKNRSFMAHPCCQKWLDNLFMGQIRIRDALYGEMRVPEWVKILLSAFLIFPMYIWIRFDVPDENPNYMRERTNYLISDGFSDHCHGHELNAQARKGKHTYAARRTDLAMWEKIYYMWSAPITKFWVHQVFYFLYLALLSLAAIWPSCGNPFLDFILCIWTTVITMDSIYSAYSLHKKYPSISLVFKCLDIILISAFTILYMLGRLLPPDMFLTGYQSKIILCIGLIFFYYRIIFLSMPISSQMGPLLYRVKRMTLVDFADYTRIALLVVVSNGIILQAIIYPDYPMGTELFFKALHRGWSSLFHTPTKDWAKPNPKCILLKKFEGENYYAGFKNNPCRAGRYYGDHCPSPGIWPIIFGVQYLMLLKLILYTLLTALFTNTEKILEAEGDDIWKYQRYELIVNFADSLRLPAPFSIISYILMGVKALYRFYRPAPEEKVQFQDEQAIKSLRCRHWQILARKYSEKKENENKDKGLSAEDRMDNMSILVDTINKQRLVIHEEESQLNELHYEIQNINLYLNSDAHNVSVRQLLRSKKITQMYSRRTPYINTSVHRTPVTDRKVPWTNLWLAYHPVAYTKFRHMFPKDMRSYLDVNVHAMQESEGENFEMPDFQWNSAVTRDPGVWVDRRSWITDEDGKAFVYQIDPEGLPRNPIGRTGLRGMGCLPRWGPNHFVFVVITQCKEALSKVSKQFLQTAVQVTNRTLSLPGGFVKTENRYKVVQDCFKCEETWSDKEDMIAYLQQASSNPEGEDQFKAQMIQIGYMDEALNTDHAWCEAEIWHFHFVGAHNLDEKLQGNIRWALVSDELLKKLTIGQAHFLYRIAKEMKTIF